MQSDMCSACNVAAVACITAGINSTEQPSSCCTHGTCGQPYVIEVFLDPDYKGLTPGVLSGEGNSGTGPLTDGIDGPGVSTWPSGGTCRFPDGTIIPCG